MKVFVKWLLIPGFFLICFFTAVQSQPGATPFYFKGDSKYPPYEFLDKNGNPAGFNVEILRAVANVMNIPIKIELDAWNQVRSDLESGVIDGVTGMYFSENRQELADFSIPFLIVSHSIFVRKNSKLTSIEDVQGKKIIVQNGDIMHDFVLKNQLSNKIFPVENQKDAVVLLAKGEYDCAILAKLQGLYHIHELKLDNLQAVGPTIEPKEYCIAVRKENRVLLSQINEGLNIVKRNGTYDQIYKKWFGIYEKRHYYQRLKYFIWGFVLILVFLVIGFMWNVSLKIQVARQTRELQQEIGERIKAETALRKSEEKYRSLFNNSNDAIYLLYKGKFEIVNEKFQKMLEISQAEIQRDDFDFMSLVSEQSKSFIAERQARLDRGEDVPLKYEFTVVSTSGKEIEVEASVSYIQYKDGIGTQGILRDITSRKKLEAQLNQMQKMDAIGTMAGGIAHDFNNLLTAIIGHAEIALMQLDQWNPAFNELMAIKSAGQRAEDLTSKLLAFSRKQIYKPRILNLNQTIQDLERILRRLISENIKLKLTLNRKIPEIKADPGQIEQILINLVVNARDAIHQKQIKNQSSDEIITIKTDFANTDDWFLASLAADNSGEHVLFSVCDTGIGMNPADLSKIFDPFFTTKEVGKGTGLGLATVYGIVQQNKAAIHVDSEEGRGATFKVYWPITREKQKETKETVPQNIETGNETILLVEDDDNVRDFATTALKKIGYHVYSAENGNVALDLIKKNAFQVDLLITDLVMPQMNGKELAVKVLELIPDVVVLYTSGYADDHIISSGILEDDVNFIQKPYTLQTLSSRIRELLSR